ncbi:MAG: NAD+ synthase [Thermoplasmata archaeon]
MIELSLPELAEETIEDFIRNFSNGKRVVIGLSGGIDSTLVLYLLVKSIGKENVIGIHLPEKTTDPKDTEDVKKIASINGIDLIIEHLDDYVQPFKKNINDIRILGNVKARMRMVYLYSISNSIGGLVSGTSNKSELLTGYFTKYGDGAADFYPIGDLYKTQVRLLAKKIGIPEEIINKIPTAGLWENQTDETELGISYDDLDKILYGIEQLYDDIKIHEETNIPIEKIKYVRNLVDKTKHKRNMYIPKIGIRTVGLDWRE